jgi:hypothetical protein
MSTYATEPPKVEKSKIVDVDSLFAFDSSTTDDPSSKGPMSSVFFDSVAPAGRASRFRQLFAQDAAPPPIERENRHPVDRMPSNSAFAALNKPPPSASVEDREGFQRIMAMLGGGGSGGPNPNRPAVRHRFHPSNSYSSLINPRHCNNLRPHPCKTIQLKTNPRANSFNDSCVKDNPWEATHRQHSRINP